MSSKTVPKARPLPAWVRFYFYGLHGLFDEVFFTALFDLYFEPRGNTQLKGYSTISSFFIYGSCSFFVERVYVFLYLKHGIPLYFRLPLYLIILYTWEFCFGLLLRHFNACSWDYSHYPLNFMGLITLMYAPAWLLACAYQDVLSDYLLSLRITTNGSRQIVGLKES